MTSFRNSGNVLLWNTCLKPGLLCQPWQIPYRRRTSVFAEPAPPPYNPSLIDNGNCKNCSCFLVGLHSPLVNAIMQTSYISYLHTYSECQLVLLYNIYSYHLFEV